MVGLKQVASQPTVLFQDVGLYIPETAAPQDKDFGVIGKYGKVKDSVTVRVRQSNGAEHQAITHADDRQGVETGEHRRHAAPSPWLINKRITTTKQDEGAEPQGQRGNA